MIDVSFVERIAVMRLDHGPVNALDGEVLSRLVATLDELPSRADAVILTGAGFSFSAGADLVRLVREGSAYVEAARPHADRAFERMFLTPLPMVAAINGHAIAGGFVLALACDHRLCGSGDIRIGLPELRVGVPFPMWALEIVRFAVAPPHLQRLLYSGRLLGPEDALAVGLVDEVVPSDRLMEEALKAARRLASIPPATFALTKMALREPFAERAKRSRKRDDESMSIWSSDETRSAVRHFLERTLGRG